MKRTITLYYLLFMLVSFVVAQGGHQKIDSTIFLNQIPEPTQQISPIPFEHFNSEQGLSNGLNSVFQDKKGFLWVTSSDAIYRYDGFEFKPFTKKADRPEGLANNWTYKVFGDKDGGIWVRSRGNILHVFDEAEEQFQRLNLKSASASDSSTVEVIYFLGDQQKRLWVATKNHGLNQLDRKSGQLTNIDLGEETATVIRMIEDKDANLWLVTNTHLMRLHMDGEQAQIKHYPQIKTHHRTWLIQDQAAYICIADSPSSMIRFHPDQDDFVRYEYEGIPFENDRVNNIHQARDGKYWIATNFTGLRILDLETAKVTVLRNNSDDPKGINVDGIMDIHEDKSGGIWLATWGGGLNYYNPQKAKFGHHYAIPGLDYTLQKNRISVFYQDHKNRIWVNGDALYEFKKETGRFHRFPLNNSKKFTKYERVNALIDITTDNATNTDQFLVGSNHGLVYFDAHTGQFTDWKSPTPEGEILERIIIQYLTKDKKNRIWIIGYDSYIFCYDADMKNLRQYKLPDSPVASETTYLLADQQHQIWCIRKEKKLYRLDLTTEKMEHIVFETNSNGEFPQHEIICFWKDSRGQQWIGTYQGLFLITPPENKGGKYRFRAFTELDGLADVLVHGILEDDQGFIWISTNDGLSKMDTKTFAIRNYTQNDGLQGPIFGYNSFYKNSITGELYFGGGEGMNVFNPEDIKDDTVVPLIAMLDISVFRDSSMQTLIPKVEEDNPPSISLNYDDKILTIDYAALHYAAPALNEYAIQMEGYEENWRYVQQQNKATYTNLDAGTYVFKVKASNKDGVWNEEGTALQVVVHPPWWETWWAYSIYALIILALIAMIYSFLKKRWELRNSLRLEQEEATRLKELDSFKSKLYTNLTHEFRTPLTVILGMVDQMEDNPKNHFETGVQLIRRNGNNLLRLINQLLDLSKLENKSFQLQLKQDNIIPYLAYLVEAFQSYANTKNLSLRFFTTKESLVMDYDPEQIKQIVTNLISNAVKFTPNGGEIKVQITTKPVLASEAENEQLQIVVQDSGIGIAAKNLSNIFDRFYQVDGSTTRQGEGTGIGLAHTQELVRLMGGEISVKSDLGKGSQFLVCLPIRRRSMVSATAAASMQTELLPGLEQISQSIDHSRSENGTSRQAKQASVVPRLLIIEDNPDVVVYLKTCLEAFYQIDVAYNGKVGIEKAIENTPDLIISDVMMPEKDGLEVCDTLKNDERTSHIPIILLTAKADISSKLAGLKRGADAYLAKPFHKEELLIRLERLVAKQKRLTAYFSKLFQAESVHTVNDIPEEMELKVEDAFIQKVRKIVEDNYANEYFALPQLCQEMAMSRSQLYRKMKALADISPSDFIKKYRLQKAKIILGTGEMNVAEAAYEVGFSDPSYFSKIFQKEFGFLPSEIGK